MLIPVLLAGGVGSRLWPLSRESYPKQFLALQDNNTLLQNTIKRLHGLENLAAPITVCNEEHRFLVAEQLRQLNIHDSKIILEPEGKNTAPAVALAAMQIAKSNPEALMMVLPADHVIKDDALFRETLTQGVHSAKQGQLVTFGIVPNAAETGYGYIKRGQPMGSNNAFSIAQFIEKPEQEIAQRYIEEPGYYWNSGMFLFTAERYLQELQKFAPDIFEACQLAMGHITADLDFVRVDTAAFAKCRADSIDYAIMEKTDSAVVLPLDAEWDDVGSWSALWNTGDQDENGNVMQGDVTAIDVENCYLHSDSRMIATIGLKEHVVIETSDAVLVAPRDRVQDIKQLVNQLKVENRSEATTHRKVYRPWGHYESIDSSERFQVKNITVNPQQQLSLQMHYHRAEHWIVVEGTAKVTCDDKEVLLSENESTYIPIGATHRLENPGKVPLVLIEIQSGSYLGEDDIVRFEDIYGREEEKA